MSPAAPETPRIRRGSARYWRANAALFLAGFSTFALLYCVQPLLPVFAEEFRIDAGTSSFALSLTTGVLAVSMLFASWLADSWGRKHLIAASLTAAAVLGLLSAVMPGWESLLAMRTALGLALSGVPAVAMAYLAEEMEPDAYGVSMGLYIGGNALGGMSGRLLVGIIADITSWRLAMGGLAVMVLGSSAVFWWLLPRPLHSTLRRIGARRFVKTVAQQFRDPGLRWLFATPFLVMGAFVTLYNYAAFRLSAPPYALSQGVISVVFVIYLVGTGSSTWIGALAGRLGRRKVLWSMVSVMAAGLALTVLAPLWAVITGLVVATFGFFGAHSIASSWVGRRAREGRAQASAIYLFFYYLGSSVIGSLGGFAWNRWAWDGVTLVAGAAIALALLIAVRLFFLPPLPLPETPVRPPQSL